MPDKEPVNGRERSVGYAFTQLDDVIHVDYAISFHYYEYAPNYCGLVESHNFWEMVYADSGSLICCAGDKEIHLTQGQAVFHPPNETHQLLAMGEDSSACILSFSCGQMDAEMFRARTIPLTQTQKNLVGMLYQEGRAAFEGPYNLLYQAKLVRRPGAPYGAEQVYKNILENLLLLIVRDLTQPLIAGARAQARDPANDRAIVERVIEYLNANLYRKVSMSDLCGALSFSESYLREVFRKEKGNSVMAYFTGMKIFQAKKFIGSGNYTFTQIAEMLGFSSVHYFSRTFRQNVKMSPSEYEKSVKLTALL